MLHLQWLTHLRTRLIGARLQVKLWRTKESDVLSSNKYQNVLDKINLNINPDIAQKGSIGSSSTAGYIESGLKNLDNRF